MGIQVCTFNDVNGQNTGVHVRTGKGENFPSRGILFKKYISKGQFKVNTDDAENGWYRLHSPKDYGFNDEKLYVKLKQTYIKSPNISELNTAVANANARKAAENNLQLMSTTSTTSTSSSTNVNTMNYSQGMDDAIYAMLQREFDLSNLNTNTRIMGTPFRFLKSADYRPTTDIDLGRQYIENILAEAPIVHLIPGIPSYMPGINESEQEAIDNFIRARYNNSDISNEALEKILTTEGRYFEFQSAYAEYVRYVNLLCRICSVYMGISEKNVPGTNEKYITYDWGKWTNTNYNTNKKQKSDDKNMWEKGVENISDFIADEIFGEYKYVKCYVDPNSSFTESSSNQTGQSQIAGLFDTMEGIVREIGFFSNGSGLLSGVTDSVSGGLSDISEQIRQSLDSNTSAGLSKIIGSAEKVLTGSNIIFPELWTDSSTSKSYNFTINLISPYGDDESIFLNIIMPIMHFIALAMPRQTSANSFGSPFILKLFSKGHISCDMGIITNISIDKGGDGTAWTVTGLPLEAKISISVADLYDSLMISKTSEPGLFFKNQGLIDFLAVTCGMDITRPNFAMKIESIISTYKSTLFDVPSNVYDNVIQGLRNSLESYFKIGNY